MEHSFAPVLRRRDLLAWAGAGSLGVSLSSLIAARAATATAATQPLQQRIKACIVIFYYGGPSHLDSLDPKPLAPAEVRGEFQPIQTSAGGILLSEHLPHLAKVMHKAVVIRSMHHQMRLHDAACVETLTGRQPARGDGENFTPPLQSTLFPAVGEAYGFLSRHQRLVVPHAALPCVIRNVVTVPCQDGGFLGDSFRPFQIGGDVSAGKYRADALALPADVPIVRVRDREALKRTIGSQRLVSDGVRRLSDHYQKAYDLLASQAVQRALDIDQEDARTREKYGLGTQFSAGATSPPGANGGHNGLYAPLRCQNLLLARRLVEAGVPFVNVYDYQQQGQNWDAHSDNFNQHKNFLLPAADRALSALIEDLDERGLLDTTLVIALGEFGRTPRINENAGRDHWPDCYSAILAGGGARGGTVYGASDKLGAYPAEKPVRPADLAATIFTRFGIDPATEIHDATGRPYQLSDGQPLTELFA